VLEYSVTAAKFARSDGDDVVTYHGQYTLTETFLFRVRKHVSIN
jgi:hypothetical protein